jgi:hypothetical protein
VSKAILTLDIKCPSSIHPAIINFLHIINIKLYIYIKFYLNTKFNDAAALLNININDVRGK